MANSLKTLLKEGLNQLSLPYREEQIERLLLYHSELERANRRYNLVKAEGEELIIKHILDSLAGLSSVAKLAPKRVADLGSGGGLPGIPLALFMEDSQFTLVERSERRAGFLHMILPLLELSSKVSVKECDYRALNTQFDKILFRAFQKVTPSFIESVVKLLAPKGAIVAYQGKVDKSLKESLSSCYRIGTLPLKVPFLEGERHLLTISLKR